MKHLLQLTKIVLIFISISLFSRGTWELFSTLADLNFNQNVTGIPQNHELFDINPSLDLFEDPQTPYQSDPFIGSFKTPDGDLVITRVGLRMYSGELWIDGSKGNLSLFMDNPTTLSGLLDIDGHKRLFKLVRIQNQDGEIIQSFIGARISL